MRGVTLLHGYRCQFCSRPHVEGEPNDRCDGGQELRVAAEALERVAYLQSIMVGQDPPQEWEAMPEWHVQDEPGQRTFSLTLRHKR